MQLMEKELSKSPIVVTNWALLARGSNDSTKICACQWSAFRIPPLGV